METQYEPSHTSNETPDNAQQGNAESTTKKAHVVQVLRNVRLRWKNGVKS